MLLVGLGLEVTCVILAVTEAAKTRARIAISVFEFPNCARRARVYGDKLVSFAYYAVVIPIVHTRISRVPSMDRSYAVAPRLRASDASIAIVVILVESLR